MRLSARSWGLMNLAEKLARALEIGRGVDLHAEPAGLDQADRDAHSGFERAQLLEAFALFEHAPWQSDKALQRLAPIGIKPDVLVMRPISPWHHRLAEIERARRLARVGKAGNHLVDAGIGEGGFVFDYRGECGDVDLRVGEARKRHPNRGRIEKREIALDVDDGVKAAIGV